MENLDMIGADVQNILDKAKINCQGNVKGRKG